MTAPDTAAAAATGTATGPASAAEAAPVQLARSELSATLSDFPKLSQTIHASFTADGLRIDSLAPGSLFARIGLHAGDVVTAVDRQPLRSLDDAANLYARADTARALQIHVQRAHAAILLNVAIH